MTHRFVCTGLVGIHILPDGRHCEDGGYVRDLSHSTNTVTLEGTSAEFLFYFWHTRFSQTPCFQS
jgi:hypothetical protein